MNEVGQHECEDASKLLRVSDCLESVEQYVLENCHYRLLRNNPYCWITEKNNNEKSCNSHNLQTYTLA